MQCFGNPLVRIADTACAVSLFFPIGPIFDRVHYSRLTRNRIWLESKKYFHILLGKIQEKLQELTRLWISSVPT